MAITELKIILPELMLVLIALIGQMIGIFTSKPKTSTNFFIITSIGLCYLLLNLQDVRLGFHDMFAASLELNFQKAIILGFAIMVILLYRDFCDIAGVVLKSEFITLLLLSVVGIFISISSRNFLLLFCAVELQALTSYALTAFNVNSAKSSEGALKYFILGALISAISAFGISFIYGFSGSLDFGSIGNIMLENPNIGLIIGITFVLISIFFKLSAAPMHFWTPDTYEGAPISSVSYFASAAKIGALIVLINLMTYIAYSYTEISITLVKIVAILSMIIGTFGALKQTSLKRLMGYSTILNIGYSLIAVSLHNDKSYEVALINLVIYALSAIGFFALLIALLGAKSDDATFDNLMGAAGQRKAIAAGMLIIMSSMIGIPPFAGFFGKYYIFYDAIKYGEFGLVTIGILTSVISSYYYLKIIKSLYFTKAPTGDIRIPTRTGLLLVSILATGFILFAPIFFMNIP